MSAFLLAERPFSRLVTLGTKVSYNDLITIQEKAKLARLSRSAFLRQAALASEVKPVVIASINREQWEDLGRMGACINQIAARLNSGGVLDAQASEILNYNRELLAEVRAALIQTGEAYHGV